jgi:DNA-binding transcriptional ArsR family regulator
VTARQLEDDARRGWCRELGPTAYVVLEELVSVATADGAALVASSNVRQLACDLGLSKDTVARAVRRLLAAGAVVRMSSPRSGRGRFGTAAYRLDPLLVRSDRPESVGALKNPRARRVVQATLFDPAASEGPS